MTAADHANTVREQIVKYPHSGASLNALDALLAQAETAEEWERRCKLEYKVRMDTKEMMESAEAERDEALKRIEVLEIMDMTATAKQWEMGMKHEKARAEAAEDDRDRLQRQVSELVRTARSEQVRANNAEAERDHAQAALRRIAETAEDSDEEIARLEGALDQAHKDYDETKDERDQALRVEESLKANHEPCPVRPAHARPRRTMGARGDICRMTSGLLATVSVVLTRLLIRRSSMKATKGTV